MLLNPYRFGGGGGAPITYATWNPSDKGAGIALSNGNLTAQRTGGSTWESVRATKALTGKRYWEVGAGWIGGGEVGAVGIAPAGFALSSATQYLGKNATDCGIWGPTSAVYRADAVVFNGPDAGAASYMFAFDADTGKLWIGLTSLGWFTGDPAAGTSPTVTMPAGTYYPAATASDASLITANFGASAFAATPPAGFSAP